MHLTAFGAYDRPLHAARLIDFSEREENPHAKAHSLKEGQKARITGIDGDRRYLSRITSIGLNIGCSLEMLQNVKNRPILVYGRDTMIALNRTESERIQVEVQD